VAGSELRVSCSEGERDLDLFVVEYLTAAKIQQIMIREKEEKLFCTNGDTLVMILKRRKGAPSAVHGKFADTANEIMLVNSRVKF